MAETSLKERWIQVFNVAHADPAALGGLACPSCGDRALRLVYLISSLDDTTGIFAFWCDGCLNGLAPNAFRVPPKGALVLSDEFDLPDYTVVQD